MNGIILAGGQSSRMGQPKSLLEYHGKPQYLYAAELLSSFCGQVYISCRAEQQTIFQGFETIPDSNIYGNIGPLNGILSAFDRASEAAWMVLGCDYPFLEKSDIEQLIRERDPACLATVFSNPETGFSEPLLDIYEPAAGPLWQEWLQGGQDSIRRFLDKNAVKRVIPKHLACLKSVDTPEEKGKVVFP